MIVSTGTVFTIVISLLPALAAFGALLIVARVRRATLWMIPGWLASAALAPVLATFFGVRSIISAMKGLADGGGGIGAVSAGMWEATQPLVWASYLACVLAFTTALLGIRAVAEAEEPSDSSWRAVIGFVVASVTFAGLIATALLFRGTSRLIIDIIDPRLVQTVPTAEISRLVATRLLAAAALSVVTTLLLLASAVVSAVASQSQPPHPVVARASVFVSLMAVFVFGATALAHRSWAARLYETALTGQFPR